MGGQYSVQNTKELLDLGLASYAAYTFAKADGKLDWADLKFLMAVFPAAGPALDKIDQVPKELGELDQADATEILAYAGQKLPGLVDAEVTAVVNAFLTGVVHLLIGIHLLTKKKISVDIKRLSFPLVTA